MVKLPCQIFYGAQLPVCLWFLARNQSADDRRCFVDHLEVEDQLVFTA